MCTFGGSAKPFNHRVQRTALASTIGGTLLGRHNQSQPRTQPYALRPDRKMAC